MTPKDREYSLLAQAPAARDLPIALAHCLASAKPGTERMELLNRLFIGLEFQSKMRCQAELTMCRRAIRGELRAEAV